MSGGEDIVPRVAVKSHLDGDPKPRLSEMVEWDAMRRQYDLDEMLAMIALPGESATDSPMPGYALHFWRIHERITGDLAVATEVAIEVVPDR